MGKKTEDTYFIVNYRDVKEDDIITLKAKVVTDSSLGLSFISISDFIFESDSLVVNPSEENQKKHFKNIKTLHLSIYSVVSIEEAGLEHQGLAFNNDKSNLVVLSNDKGNSGNPENPDNS